MSPLVLVSIAVLALVALVQGTAWAGGRRVGARRRWQGATLAAIGYALFAGAIATLLAPSLFGG